VPIVNAQARLGLSVAKISGLSGLVQNYHKFTPATPWAARSAYGAATNRLLWVGCRFSAAWQHIDKSRYPDSRGAESELLKRVF
jgi:hypothetical protein